MRWRRVAWIAAVSVAVLGLAALGLHLWARHELAIERTETARLIEGARRTTAQATALLTSGRYDLAARASSALLARVLGELNGYEQVTRRGNHFRIEQIDVRMLDGYAELRARAAFDWRLGLYHGPVLATYLAFARSTPEGETTLHFRVAEVEPLAPWRLFNGWLAPLLTLRLERSLQVPEFRLPLSLRLPGTESEDAGADEAPSRPRRPSRRNVRLSLGRTWDLGGRRALPFVTPNELGVVLEAAQPSDPPDTELAATRSDEVEVAARVGLVAELLLRAFKTGGGASLEIARLPHVWSRQGSLARTVFDNQVDIERLRGTVEVARLEALSGKQSIAVSADLTGRFAGMLRGSLYGVSFTMPMALRSATRVTLPVRVRERDGGLAFELVSGSLSLPLDVATSVGGRELRFTYPLLLRSEVLDRSAQFPGLVVRTLRVPARVERGQILATRAVPLHVAWHVDLPDSASGFVRARGSVHLGEP